MKHLSRIYESAMLKHLKKDRQMLFVSGPRQVGKSTLCKLLSDFVFNWDNQQNRAVILKGPDAVAELSELNRINDKIIIISFDEIHKYGKWKSFLKGFYDTYADSAKIIVTGSSRLDLYKKGGDSLMGRYFLYHIHPFSVAEIAGQKLNSRLISSPKEISDKDWNALWNHGGFPEPFIKRESTFTRKWNRTRKNQLLREDVRDITRIQEIGQLEILAEILESRSGEQIKHTTLSNEVRVSENTVRKWVTSLNSLNFGFSIKPWYKNIKNSLIKEPKWYCRDWSQIKDEGKRAETFVANQLLKSVEFWTDAGYGDFGLYYIRDKQKHEVDFLVTRDKTPWFLAEVKYSDTKISPNLYLMQKQTGATHAFQVVINTPFHKTSCFTRTKPVVVSARTFLSQLV